MAKITLPNRFSPLPHQERYMGYFDSGGKRACWVVHRRAGKDLTTLHQTAKMAHLREGIYWHMLPQSNQARRAIWNGKDNQGRPFIDTAFPPELVRRKNNTEMLLELKCGSLFQVVGSDNVDALVGANPCHVTFSEWSISRPQAWDFVRPILRANDGSAAFIFTTRGKNHGYTTYNVARQSPSWFCELLTVEDTGMITPEQIEEERQDGMPEELIQQEYYCSFDAGNVGAYYAHLLSQLDANSLIHPFPYSVDRIFTHWDIGFTDSTAIWFWKFRQDGNIDIVDYYEANNLTVYQYIDVLQQKGYQYLAHFLPHDANDARFKFATGMTIKEQLREALPNIHIIPKLSEQDGIQAARKILSQKTRFHKTNCKKGLLALETFSRKYDEDKKQFSDRPQESWANHGADAFRYLAICVDTCRKLWHDARETPQKPAPTIYEVPFDDFQVVSSLDDYM